MASSAVSDRRRLEAFRQGVRGRVFEEKVDLLERLETAETLETGKAGWIKLDALVAACKECGVQMESRDVEVVRRKFGDAHENVNYRALVRFVGILPSEDYVDPSLRKDRLPQPYRMICKVLEDNIVDAAWEMVLLRNPALRHKDIPLEETEEGAQSNQENSKYSMSKRAGKSQENIELEDRMKAIKAIRDKLQKVRVCSSSSGTVEVNCQNDIVIDSANCGLSVVGDSKGQLFCLAEGSVASSSVETTPAFLNHAEVQEEVDSPTCPSGEENSPVTQIRILAKEGNSVFWVVAASSVVGSSSARISLLELSLLRSRGSQFRYISSAVLEEGICALWATVSRSGHVMIATMGEKGFAMRILETDGGPAPCEVRFSGIQSIESKAAAGCFSGNSFFLYQLHECTVYECSAVGLDKGKQAGGVIAAKAIWMPSEVLCHASHGTSAGVQLVAFGLSNGCTVVWNALASAVRAILRMQHSPVTTVAFHDIESQRSVEGKKQLYRSDSSVQLLIGCADGKVRLWQLTSDAPASAAVRPRERSEEDEFLGARKEDDAQEILASKLMGGVFVAEMLEFLTSSNDLAREERLSMGKERAIITKFIPITGTPLWVAQVHWSSTAQEGAAALQGSVEIRVFDCAIGAQVGRVRAEGTPEREWSEGVHALALGDSIGILQRPSLEKDQRTTVLTVYSVAKYVPTFFPSIARACGLRRATSPNSRPGSPAVGFLQDTCPKQSQSYAAELRIKTDVRKLLAGTLGTERCDTNLSLVLPNESAVPTADLSSPCSQTSPSSPKLKSPLGLTLPSSLRSPKATSPRLSPRGSSSSPPGSPGLQNPMTFSRVGMIAAKLKSRKDQAGKNVLNPTRLSESLEANLGSQKRADFEKKRRATRASREAALESRLKALTSV